MSPLNLIISKCEDKIINMDLLFTSERRIYLNYWKNLYEISIKFSIVHIFVDVLYFANSNLPLSSDKSLYSLNTIMRTQILVMSLYKISHYKSWMHFPLFIYYITRTIYSYYIQSQFA